MKQIIGEYTVSTFFGDGIERILARNVICEVDEKKFVVKGFYREAFDFCLGSKDLKLEREKSNFAGIMTRIEEIEEGCFRICARGSGRPYLFTKIE